MSQREPSDWHDQIDGGQYQDFSSYAERIEQVVRQLAKRMRHTEDRDVARGKRGQLPGNDGDDEEADRQKNDEHIRHDRRDDKSASAYGDAVIEND